MGFLSIRPEILGPHAAYGFLRQGRARGVGGLSRARGVGINRTASPSGEGSYSREAMNYRQRFKGNWRVLSTLLGVALVGLGGISLYRFGVHGEPIESVAILPLMNEGANPDTTYLSDGIAEGLINRISQLPKLKVIALSSVVKYRGREVDPKAAAHELGVRAVLTGRMLQRGDGLSISLELMDAQDNRHLWGQRYDRKLSDLMASQEEICLAIEQNLRPHLSGDEKQRSRRGDTQNPEAYQRYLQGRYFLNKRARSDKERAIEHFQAALAQDPGFALAYAGLGYAYAGLGSLSLPVPLKREVQQKGKAAVLKALELDDRLAEAHLALGVIRRLNWEWADAEREYMRAIELNPNYAGAHMRYAGHLAGMGRRQEALAEAKRAEELDPLSINTNLTLGEVHLGLHQYDQAMQANRRALELDRYAPNVHQHIARCYEAQGRYEEAIAEAKNEAAYAEEMRGQARTEIGRGERSLLTNAYLAQLYARSGRKAEARKILEELKERSNKEPSAGYVAQIYAALGEREQMFEWLEKAFIERSPTGMWGTIMGAELWDPYRSDPRFVDILRRMGLPPKNSDE